MSLIEGVACNINHPKFCALLKVDRQFPVMEWTTFGSCIQKPLVKCDGSVHELGFRAGGLLPWPWDEHDKHLKTLKV